MRNSTEFIGLVVRWIPLTILIALVVMMIRGGSADRILEESAGLVDRNEDGELSVLQFTGAAPNADHLRSLESLRRLAVEETTIATDLAAAITSLQGLTSLSLAGCAISEQDLRLLNKIPDLIELDLSGTPDLSNGLLALQLSKLRSLKLNDCAWMDDELVAGLSQFPELETLELINTQISDAGIQPLRLLTNLRWLNLSECSNIGEGTLTQLSGLSPLQSLALSGQNLSLSAARTFHDSQPPIRLLVPLGEFQELRPILDRDSSLSETATYYFSHGLHYLNIHDESGTDYSPLKYFPELTSVSLSGRAITDKSLEFVPALQNLAFLRLMNTHISDNGLEHLANATQLQSLDLTGADVTDQGVRHLTGLTELKMLDLSDTKITQAGVKELLQLTGLQYFGVQGVSVTDVDVRIQLSALTINGSLDLNSSNITTAQLVQLSGKPFRVVNLSNLSLSADDFEVVKTWTELSSLNLSGTSVTGEEMQLANNQKLTALNMNRTRITDSAIRNLDFPPSLKSLSLAGSSVNGATLTKLADLHLKYLNLTDTPLSEQGVVNAFALKPKTLDLNLVFVKPQLPTIDTSDTGIESLSLHAQSPILTCVLENPGAKTLRRLTLHGADNQQLKRIMGLPRLLHLTLYFGTFEESSFGHLAEHSNLSSLWLMNCTLTADAISEIGAMQGLKSLRVWCPKMTEQDFASLRRAKPELEILWQTESPSRF